MGELHTIFKRWAHMNLHHGITMLFAVAVFCCRCDGLRMQMEQSSQTDIPPFITPTYIAGKIKRAFRHTCLYYSSCLSGCLWALTDVSSNHQQWLSDLFPKRWQPKSSWVRARSEGRAFSLWADQNWIPSAGLPWSHLAPREPPQLSDGFAFAFCIVLHPHFIVFWKKFVKGGE